MPKYKQLRIDGVLGDIWDDAAVHNEDVVDVVLNVLDSPIIRSALLNIYHPIGSYYFTDRDVNPSTFLGGSWRKVEGRVLLGASSKYPANSTGGYEDSTVPTHTHTISGTTSAAGSHSHTGTGSAAEAGSHSHITSTFPTASGTWSNETVGRIGGSGWQMIQTTGSWWGTSGTGNAGSHTHEVSINTDTADPHTHTLTLSAANTGESGVGKNMMPYIAAYIWVRYA